MNFFKKKSSTDDIVQQMVNMTNSISFSLEEKSKSKQELICAEITTYLYTILDRKLAEAKKTEDERTTWFNGFDKIVANYLQEANINITEKEIKEFFDLRIKYYYLIGNKAGSYSSSKYYEDVINYQVQLIGNILTDTRISKYNPVPEHTWEYSPMILDLFFTQKIRIALSEAYINQLPLLLKIIQSHF